MNKAQFIAKLHHDRDDASFNHIIAAIDKYLNDTTWLLSEDSHARSEDNMFRYDFNITLMYREFVDPDERQWAPTVLKERLIEHYRTQGFEAFFFTQDQMTLKVDGRDIGLEEVKDDEAV